MMTVAHLIDKLKEFPSDLRVIIDAPEEGSRDVEFCKQVEIYLDVYDCGCCGPHEEPGRVRGRVPDNVIANAIKENAIEIGYGG